jgi:putative peptidoglycan binding protein
MSFWDKVLNFLNELFGSETDVVVPPPEPPPARVSYLSKGSKGPEVQALKVQLNKFGYHLDVNNDNFLIETESAVRDFQRKAGLRDDGVVGTDTTKALSRMPKLEEPVPTPAPVILGSSTFTKAKLAIFAENFCKQNFTRHSPEVHKIREPFAAKPLNFGFGDWAHCGATVFFEICSVLGRTMAPLFGTGYSWAYVEGIQKWAQSKGFYHDNDGIYVPKPGCLTIYDWTQKNINDIDKDVDDHVAVHLRKSGINYVAAEGNTSLNGVSGITAIKTRSPVTIQGWVEIPDGYEFPIENGKSA